MKITSQLVPHTLPLVVYENNKIKNTKKEEQIKIIDSKSNINRYYY